MTSRHVSHSSVRFGTAIAIFGVLALTACSGDDSSSSSDTAGPSTDAVATTDVVVTEPTTPVSTEAPVAPTWETIEAPADCMCADGSPFHYYLREASPTKVLFYLEGGGACFSAEMCTHPGH